MKSHITNQFAEYVIRKELIKQGDHVLVAISGGVDSMVLLHLLYQWQQRFKTTLGAVHLNHQLRPIAAKRDQALVEEVCHQLQVPIFVLQKEVKTYARENKLSLEESGHLLREELFNHVAEVQGYQKIATAHHRDDQAETVLMRILSGSGLQGLASIRVKKDRWIRPLLWANREQIEKYAAENDIKFHTDESNVDLSIPRNKIRRKLIPLLQADYNPQAIKHLAQLSEISEEWDIYIQKQVGELFPQYAKVVSQNEISVGIEFFKLYFSWIQLHMIELILNRFYQKNYQVNFSQFQDFSYWIKKGRIGSNFFWTGDINCVKRKNSIDFYASEDLPVMSTILIEAGKSYLLQVDDIKISFTECHHDDVQYSDDRSIEYVSGDQLRFPLLLRPWENGDCFRPLGLEFMKSVADFLTNRKVGQPEKNRIWVLVNQGEIIAVLGHQISNDYRIQPGTKKFYRLKIEKLNHEIKNH
jgi:tRNA(Ile)-lysidine synthase